jgi:hypothetical protein
MLKSPVAKQRCVTRLVISDNVTPMSHSDKLNTVLRKYEGVSEVMVPENCALPSPNKLDLLRTKCKVTSHAMKAYVVVEVNLHSLASTRDQLHVPRRSLSQRTNSVPIE